MKFRLHNYKKPERLTEAKRSNWTVEEMKDVLARNDDQVGKALVKLYELQTEDEKASGSTHEYNSIGFNSFDAEILSSFAEFYMKHHRLSPKQLVIARKKIMKYAKQLVNIANKTNTVNEAVEKEDSFEKEFWHTFDNTYNKIYFWFEADGKTYFENQNVTVLEAYNKFKELCKTVTIKNPESLDIGVVTNSGSVIWIAMCVPSNKDPMTINVDSGIPKSKINGQHKLFVSAITQYYKKVLIEYQSKNDKTINKNKSYTISFDFFESLNNLLSKANSKKLEAFGPHSDCVLTIRADGIVYADRVVSDINTLKNIVLNFLKSEGPKIENLNSLDIAFIQYKDEDDPEGEWIVYFEPRYAGGEIDDRIRGKDKAFVETIRNEIKKLLTSEKDFWHTFDNTYNKIYFWFEADGIIYFRDPELTTLEAYNKFKAISNLIEVKDPKSLYISVITENGAGEWLVYCNPAYTSLKASGIDVVSGKHALFVPAVKDYYDKCLNEYKAKHSEVKRKDNRYTVSLDFFEGLQLQEGRLSLSIKDINKIKNEIHNKLGIPTAGMRIWPDGRFEFTNISESDARRISYGLERFDLASNIYQSKGSIDFSHYTPLGQPKSKFNVRGELNLNKLLKENLAKINEAFEDDNTCYKVTVCWDADDIDDDIMWTDEYFTAKSEEAVIEYINNNYEPYKIINISKMNMNDLSDNEKYEMFDTCIHLDEDFVNYNANPQGKNEGDCTIRALSLAYNLSYANVKSDLISLGNKGKLKFNTFPTINAFMEKHRFKKYLNNEDGSINVSTVENFAKKYHHGNYVVRCSDRSKQDMSHAFHLVAIIDGKIYDTWDSADYFVIDAWEVAGNSKHILNTKGIKESTYLPTAWKFINVGGQSIKSIKAYGLGSIDNPEQNPISKPTKISKDSGKHEEKLLQFAQRIHDKKYSDFSKNRKKSQIDLYDRFTFMLSAMDLYTIATKLPEYKLLHTPNIISYTDVSVDGTTGYIKAIYQNDAELKASTALADFYDIPYTIKKDEIIFKILPDNESWD